MRGNSLNTDSYKSPANPRTNRTRLSPTNIPHTPLTTTTNTRFRCDDQAAASNSPTLLRWAKVVSFSHKLPFLTHPATCRSLCGTKKNIFGYEFFSFGPIIFLSLSFTADLNTEEFTPHFSHEEYIQCGEGDKKWSSFVEKSGLAEKVK